MKIMIKRKTYQIIEKCLIIGVISVILVRRQIHKTSKKLREITKK